MRRATMQRIPDPYRVLGVGCDATTAEIKAAHRRLVKRFHPDTAAADDPVFLAVQGAYELLKDPLRRAEWDRKHAPGPVRAGETTSRRSPLRKRPTEPKPSEPARPAQGPKAPPWTEPGRRTAPAPDPDSSGRPSGAAWSSAARAYFRRASADMPSGAANPNTPRWTTPVGAAPKPRYDAAPRPARCVGRLDGLSGVPRREPRPAPGGLRAHIVHPRHTLHRRRLCGGRRPRPARRAGPPAVAAAPREARLTARPLGAAELLRSVGLLADGPAAWGTPVRSNRPGVYVIELPSPPQAAPGDFDAVGPGRG